MKLFDRRHCGDERLVDYESSRHNFRDHDMRSSMCPVFVANLLVVIPEMERVGSEIASLATKRDLNHRKNSVDFATCPKYDFCMIFV